MENNNEEKQPTPDQEPEKRMWGSKFALGLMLGLAIGIVLNQLILGIAVGVFIGLALEKMGKSKQDKDS